MGFRRLFVLLAVPSAIVIGASCAPVHILDVYGIGSSSSSSGAGGSLGLNAATSGAGGGVTFKDAGAHDGAPGADLLSSYGYLCGGSHATCTPGPADSCAPSAGTGGASGDAGPDGGDPPGQLSCQVVAADGGVAAACATAGAAAEGTACAAASDCQAELGCVATDVFPVCRTYCCDSLESCRPGTYCSKVAMAEPPHSLIPVCIAVTPCDLLNDASCPSGQTCAIVRESGTTSCITPGTGTNHQPCPCAAGFTCSFDDGICLELCDTTKVGVCGPNAYCQGDTLPYPAGIGICVSY